MRFPNPVSWLTAALRPRGESAAPSAAYKPPSEQPIESMRPWGGPGNLEEALAYPPLLRCVLLISEVVAQLVTDTLRVIDRDKRLVANDQTQRAVDLVVESPDDLLSPDQYWAMVMFDYLVAGNSLMEIVRGGDGTPRRLRRLDPWDTRVERSTAGRAVYMATSSGRPVVAGAANVVHVRWPMPRYPAAFGTSLDGTDDVLAPSPLRLLWPTIDLGNQSGEYVRKFFRGGPEGALQARTIITVPPASTREAMEATAKEFQRAANDLSPAVVKQGTTVDALRVEPAHNKDVELLRVFQARDVARPFGMPAPLIGEQITAWGSGIEELARLAYRFGFRQHLKNLLGPLSFRLLPRGLRFAIDELDVLAGDAQSMSRLAQVLISAEASTKEEVRTLLGLRGEMPDGEVVRSVQARAAGAEGNADAGMNGRLAQLLRRRQ